MARTSPLHRVLPFMHWLQHYNRNLFSQDATAALIISIMLIPQALAYALLAGLPPQTGLYASLLPLLAYALFGRSGALSVGPFAITSIMTAAALNHLLPDGSINDKVTAGALLAMCSGGFLLAFGMLRLGFLSNFISFPVVTGFISASALVIASSQMSHLFGLPDTHSGHFFQSIWGSVSNIGHLEPMTTALAISMLIFLKLMPPIFKRATLALTKNDLLGDIVSKSTPLFAIVISIGISVYFDFDQRGIQLVGDIPAGFPNLDIPDASALHWDAIMWKKLIGSAALISLIGFVSSLSTAQAFAAKQRQRINPNQEAFALGMSNVSSGLSGAFPVAASLSRSAISFNAGAQTPATSALTAISIALSCLFLTPYLYHLPIATLTAMIVLAVLSLFDWQGIKRTWKYSGHDFASLALTMALTLIQGVEWGLIGGVALSIILYLHRSSKPHIAVLGQVPNMEHFRNIDRHDVITDEKILSVRVDASLYFANARFLEDKINQLLSHFMQAEHLILNCAAINSIDASALESLIEMNEHLNEAGIQFHLSEVKGPVMDRLKGSSLMNDLTGNIYLSHHQAWVDLKQ